MSDPDSPLSPTQDDAVRAYLAAARHTDPVPRDVVARLDATLASLREERLEAGSEDRAPVVTMASRRRCRAATAVLGAAAAVVLAVGLGQVLPDVLGSGSDSQTASETSASDSSAGGSSSELDEESAPDADAYESDAAPKTQDRKRSHSPGAAAASGVPALTSSKPLRPQVQQLWRGHLLSPPPPAPSCPVPGADTADQRDVRYDEKPATLVFGDPASGFQRVDVFLCGAAEPVRSVRLPLP